MYDYKELVKNSCLSIGITVDHFIDEYTAVYINKEPIGDSYATFNPIDNNNDAFYLSVVIGMIVGTYANYSTADLLTPHNRIETITVYHSSTNMDKFKSTRLAITKAASLTIA